VVPIPAHPSRLPPEEKQHAAGRKATRRTAEIARIDALPVTGQREVELGYNWSYGVTRPCPGSGAQTWDHYPSFIALQ